MHLYFPHGSVVKSLPCNAGDTGLIPGQGTKIPHALGHLSPCQRRLKTLMKSLPAVADPAKSKHKHLQKKERCM